MRPTAKSYFSGMGIMDIGLMDAGIDVVQSLDLDPDAVASMLLNKHRFSHSVLQKDIRDITVLEQVKTDIIVCTYPCTKYSTIADIHHCRTGDDLFLHAFRHIAIEQPEMYVIENVPGMKKFPVVMEAMTKLPQYYVNVFCPVDAACWLPQKRQRLILIGTKKPFHICAPSQVLNRPRIKDLLELDPNVEMPEYVVSRINGKYRDKPIVVDPDQPDAMAPTCVAHYAKDLGTRLVKDGKSRYGVRPFSIREYARLQGVPDDVIFEGKRSDYRLIGNGVAKHMAQWIGNEAIRYFN